jgi:hypothetical protein
MSKTLKGKAAAEKPPEQNLRKDLAALCKKLDEKSLKFLKDQAQTLLRNLQIEAALRDEQVEAAEAASSRQKGRPASSPETAPPDRGVRIEQTGTLTFNIYVGRARSFFNREELRSLTKIVHAAGGAPEGAKRLYVWFTRERKDFLIDTGIGTARDPSLMELYDFILRTYKVKGS